VTIGGVPACTQRDDAFVSTPEIWERRPHFSNVGLVTEIGGYCTKCGASWQSGQNYCGSCGAAVGMAGAAGTPGSTPGPAVIGSASAARAFTGSVGPVGRGIGGPAGAEPKRGDDSGYPREAMLGAVLLTIFIPFIALFAALVLRAQELRPARREQLRTWAVASGAWLATGWVIGIVVFASALSAVSPSSCKGGIDITVPPSYESSDGKHWVGTFTCMSGGTITKPVPADQVPGGG
jgi:hypothetical protein